MDTNKKMERKDFFVTKPEKASDVVDLFGAELPPDVKPYGKGTRGLAKSEMTGGAVLSLRALTRQVQQLTFELTRIKAKYPQMFE